MHMHWTEYKSTKTKRPAVRPASVDKIVTLFMDPSFPNLEHSFPISYTSKFFCVKKVNRAPVLRRTENKHYNCVRQTARHVTYSRTPC